MRVRHILFRAVSSTRGLSTNRKPYRLPTAPNPGMNVETFRAVLERPTPRMRKRYAKRWDWHLRQLIYALITPGVLWLVLRMADSWFNAEDREMIEQMLSGPKNKRKEETQDNDGEIGLEERVRRLEKQLIELHEVGGTVMKARYLAMTMARGRRPDQDESQ